MTIHEIAFFEMNLNFTLIQSYPQMLNCDELNYVLLQKTKFDVIFE